MSESESDCVYIRLNLLPDFLLNGIVFHNTPGGETFSRPSGNIIGNIVGMNFFTEGILFFLDSFLHEILFFYFFFHLWILSMSVCLSHPIREQPPRFDKSFVCEECGAKTQTIAPNRRLCDECQLQTITGKPSTNPSAQCSP